MRPVKPQKQVPVVFHGYFRKHRINALVKNLYVDLPALAVLSRRVKIRLNTVSLAPLQVFFKRGVGLKKIIRIIDLGQLKNTLAIELKKQPGHKIKLTNSSKIRYEDLDIRQMLEQQGQLLRVLVKEQQQALRENAQEIVAQEKARIREKTNSRNKKNSEE